MADELTPDEILSASAYLEAVWMEDKAAMVALMQRSSGEKPMPYAAAQQPLP